MEIGVIGAGSLGLLYAYYLSKKHKVTLYTKRQEQADQINNLGIQMVKGNSYHTANVCATSETSYKESILIITVKQYHLETIINHLKKLSSRTIVFLQNGMGHVSQLASLLHHRVFVGIAEHGALKVNEYIVHHTGEGLTKLALYQDQVEPIHDLSLLRNEQINHFPIVFLSEWEKMLKEKLIVNATINPLTALLRVKNGELLTNKYYKKLFYELFEEVILILGMEDKDKLWDHVCGICTSTSENESSMLRDIHHQRKTEIDSILGYLILNANGKSIPHVSFLFTAIKGIEVR
ncbi:2-dehydropantoate 2-reductase [Metabacillus halosaccharovorans]|uniref:2-dehydropantoate 2-reductase n=1 Tax=Metabacillus halosaccharovorans TaxID=930124 RepID=UPI0009958CE6|nr:2-dehydropantoate 2-reductase [Metabacillus halosaccharovorans]